MKDRITPVGLKGNEINERMKQLMGIQPINENKKSSVVELTKIGPDGNVYGIVRENHEYYIKITNKKSNLVTEDFSYIGGLQNKKQEVYPSYAKAIKQLNLKFNSLNEAYGKSGQINVFEDDNLLNEMGYGFSGEGNLEGNQMSECCGAQMMEGMCMECGGMGMYEGKKEKNPWAICTASVGRDDKEKYEKCVMDIKKKEGITESITEAEYSEKQKKIAKLAGDPNEIGADDLAALRAGKHMENEAVNAMMGEDDVISVKGKILDLLSNMDEGNFNSFCNHYGFKPKQDIDVSGTISDWIDGLGEKQAISVMRDMKKNYSKPFYEELSPEMEAVNAMMEDEEMTAKEKKFAALAEPKDKITYADKIAGAKKKNEGKLSIERAISEMDDIIESVIGTNKKKVYTIK